MIKDGIKEYEEQKAIQILQVKQKSEHTRQRDKSLQPEKNE